jgi:hypothetical protein
MFLSDDKEPLSADNYVLPDGNYLLADGNGPLSMDKSALPMVNESSSKRNGLSLYGAIKLPYGNDCLSSGKSFPPAAIGVSDEEVANL